MDKKLKYSFSHKIENETKKKKSWISIQRKKIQRFIFLLYCVCCPDFCKHFLFLIFRTHPLLCDLFLLKSLFTSSLYRFIFHIVFHVILAGVVVFSVVVFVVDILHVYFAHNCTRAHTIVYCNIMAGWPGLHAHVCTLFNNTNGHFHPHRYTHTHTSMHTVNKKLIIF